jgi:malate dehydrogenase
LALRVAIVGAGGAVGSTLLMHLLKSSILHRGDEIILLGRGTSQSNGRLYATRMDLLDAFDETAIRLTVCESIENLSADVVVIAAGHTISQARPNRRDLAQANLPLFQRLAERFGRSTCSALFLIVSNPVELAVATFASYLSPEKVIGIGAQQDSLRFARAIASQLGVHRSLVRASVLGEHGEAMVPIWSSVHLTVDDPQSTARLNALKARYARADIRGELSQTRKKLDELIASHRLASAYRLMEEIAPSTRIMVEPFITQSQIHSTPNATANATLELLSAAVVADGRRVHGQVQLAGQFYDIYGVCGVPLEVRLHGWQVSSQLQPTATEIVQLRAAAEAIEAASMELVAIN